MLQNDVTQAKNVRATYQSPVNKIFADLIRKTMEVYVDNMLVKSLKVDDHVMHVNEAFQILRKFRMMLNNSGKHSMSLPTSF